MLTYIINNLINASSYNIVLGGLFMVFIGIYGYVSNRRHLIISLIFVEIVFFGLSYFFLSLSLIWEDSNLAMVAIFIIILAGSESALALAIVLNYYRYTKNLMVLDDTKKATQNIMYYDNLFWEKTNK